jgi:hypothetical protein
MSSGLRPHYPPRPTAATPCVTTASYASRPLGPDFAGLARVHLPSASPWAVGDSSGDGHESAGAFSGVRLSRRGWPRGWPRGCRQSNMGVTWRLDLVQWCEHPQYVHALAVRSRVQAWISSHLGASRWPWAVSHRVGHCDESSFATPTWHFRMSWFSGSTQNCPLSSRGITRHSRSPCGVVQQDDVGHHERFC